MTNNDFSRYARQTILAGFGEAGQRKLHEATVVLVGCGATGSVIANFLARAGVGRLRIVDRDFVTESNLQRQLLFTEKDVAENLPKAVAAERALRAVNQNIVIEGLATDIHAGNIVQLLRDADLVMDGTDNFETRYLINDACVSLGKPWIYTGVVGTYGVTQTIVPGETACLRCALGEMPAPGTLPTCETAGVLGPVVGVMASLAASEAIKQLANFGTPNRSQLFFDVFDNTFHSFDVGKPRPDCPTCGQHTFEFLQAERGSRSTTLCGRNAVQVSVNPPLKLDLAALAKMLETAGTVQVNAYLLKTRVDQYALTIFADGRAIIEGTSNPEVARAVYARFVST